MLYNKKIGDIPHELEDSMIIAQYLKDLAIEAIEHQRPFPANLGISPFFVSSEGDPHILLHETITVNDRVYAIGTLKPSAPTDGPGDKPGSS